MDVLELLRLVSTGGASGVLAWVVFQYGRGDIISRPSHKDVVDPMRETIAHLRKELHDSTAEHRQAILEITDNQRAAMEEQAKTIQLLRALLEEREKRAGT
jgi:hypothetical protein